MSTDGKGNDMAAGAVDWTFGGVTRVLDQGFGEDIAGEELP